MWQESDQAVAQDLWEELGCQEKAAFVANLLV